jgi:hypothetical protein
VNSPTLQEALYVPETQEGAYSAPSSAEYTTIVFIKIGLALTKCANPIFGFGIALPKKFFPFPKQREGKRRKVSRFFT